MENLTLRLIIVDINTIKRTTRKVIKEKPNKTTEEKEKETEKHMARDRELNSAARFKVLDTKHHLIYIFTFHSSTKKIKINEKTFFSALSLLNL